MPRARFLLRLGGDLGESNEAEEPRWLATQTARCCGPALNSCRKRWYEILLLYIPDALLIRPRMTFHQIYSYSDRSKGPTRPQLESVSGYEDKKYDQAHADQHGEEQDHHCALIHKLSDVGFPYA